LTKLAGLFVKTLAKPLSKRIKHDFSRYNFTKRILIGIGQTSHTLTSRMQIWSAGYRVRSIKPLEEDQALKDGAEFVGESFVFLVSGTFVVWEYNRSAESSRQKEEKLRTQAKAERDALQDKLIALDARLKALEQVVKHNQRSILGLGGMPYVAPEAGMLVDIEDEQNHSQERKEEAIQAHRASLERPWWKVW
jgi:hypothetical protein